MALIWLLEGVLLLLGSHGHRGSFIRLLLLLMLLLNRCLLFVPRVSMICHLLLISHILLSCQGLLLL